MEVRPGYKQTDLGVIPEDWSVSELESVARIIDPQPDHRTPPEATGGEPYIGISDFLDNQTVDWVACRKIVSRAVDKQRARFQLRRGDIIFGKIGTIGSPRFIPSVPFRYALSANVLLIQPTIQPQFVMSWLQSKTCQKAITAELHSTSQAAFGINKMRLVKVPLPPSEVEQRAIADALSDADALIEFLEQLIAKKRQIKQAAMQELLTGKRRLPSFIASTDYKQTEVGEIPEDWRVAAIGDLSTCYSGGTPNTANPSFYGGEIPWITSGDLNLIRIKHVEGRITTEGLAHSAAKIVNEGTVLIALYGATAGVTAITEIRAAINQAVLAIVSNQVNPEYIFQLLRYRKDHYVATYTQGGQPNLSGDIVKAFLIAIPPTKEEQQAIAAVLTDMDAAIDAAVARLAKARTIKQGMMQELLTGRIRLV
jgi:type I restriction enzyme S subunit